MISVYSEDELYHYGVKGMKWGVRKSDLKTMSRQQRKETRKAYYKTPQGQIERATRISTILGGPVVGYVVNKELQRNIDKIKDKNLDDIPATTIKRGRDYIFEIYSEKELSKMRRLRTMDEVDDYYSKKLKSAKTKYERESAELDWDAARDDIDAGKRAIAY